ncbi:MAG: MarR family winged helix-turn-helix transcriptional regulator [Candidatus Saccharimonadales bacterium]
MTAPTYLISGVQTRAYKILRLHVYEVLSKHDLTPTCWSMLGCIVEAHNGIRLAEVAANLGVKAPLITMLANDLTGRGLIKRVPHHSDKRAKLLVMMPAGKKLVKTVEQALYDHLNQLLQGVSNQDMAAYHKVLSAIIANHETQISQS